MQKEMEKAFFGFQIIAWELAALDTRFYWERILLVGCQSVKKKF